MMRLALRIGPRLHDLLVIVATLSSSAGLACDPPQPAEYLIHHEIYGDVGRHVITFSCRGEDLVVETAASASQSRSGAPAPSSRRC